MSNEYDMIDRFLRNNLDDADYAEYSAALDGLAYPVGQGAQRQAEPEMAAYAEARVQADRTARAAEQGLCGWMQNIDKAMQEPLFQALRGIMGTKNMGQDMALLQTIRHYRAKAPPPAQVPEGRTLPKVSTPQAVAALAAMNKEYNYPCNPANCARYGWEAARRFLDAAPDQPR